VLRESIQAERGGKEPHALGALFCLYAAETFRREHMQGPWAWETVFRPTRMAVPQHQTIARWVESGLRWWKRDLIVSGSGTREFLITIACEGGLPLRLLQQEGAQLRHYFQAVMEQYHASGTRGREIAIAAARREIQRLPTSLRQEAVVILAAELISGVTELQKLVGDAKSPLEALDSRVPDWRRQLPLRLEDEVAEALVSGLVRQSGELVEAADARLRWQGVLKQDLSGSWAFERTLFLPERIPIAAVRAWLDGAPDDPPRVRLMLRGSETTQAIAWLTRTQASGHAAAYYRREWLARDAGKVRGGAVTQAFVLVGSDGQSEYTLPPQEGQQWGDSPWVFVPDANGVDWRWLAEGSVRTKSEEALVAVPTDFEPEPGTENDVEPMGVCREVGRKIYKTRNGVFFRTPEDDRYQVVCRSELDSSDAFQLFGESLAVFDHRRPMYKGLPTLAMTGGAGPENARPLGLQWRPLGGGTWRTGQEGCWGRIWVRLIDRSNGVEVVRRQADVLPQAFHLSRTIGVGTCPGSYEFSGLEGARVGLVGGANTEVEIVPAPGKVKVVCAPVRDADLPSLPLEFSWHDDVRLEVNLPYPQRGALFELGGRTLLRDEPVALDRLFGLKLTVQDPAGGAHFWLTSRLSGPGGADVAGDRFAFRERLPALREGILETSMTPWRDRISALLAASEEPDAQVRLEITAGVEHVMAAIMVSRFDMKVEPAERGFVTVPWRDLQRLGEDWQDRVTMDLLPLWSPDATPMRLNESPDRPGYWVVPDPIPPGPWWIVGRDGAWARFRPLLLNIREGIPERASYGDGLSAAIREVDPLVRQSELDRVLGNLGMDPEHPDWPLLFRYVAMTREFPAAYLDVLKALVKHPLTLSLALFKAGENVFEDAWNFPEQMAFSWALIPVHCWKITGQRFFSSLRNGFAEIESGEDLVWDTFRRFRDLTVGHRDYWAPLCDWLQETLFPEKVLENSALQLLRHMPTFGGEQLREAEMQLQGRHQADEIWPKGDRVIQQAKSLIAEPHYRFEHLELEYRPVRCAPFVAAAIALNGIDVSPMLVHELRLIRNFDGEWFSRAYTIALTAGLAERYPEMRI